MLSIFRRMAVEPRGFTVVEVMIVLAIAGVIMSTVFLAVPQLQRNSRDSQRQSILQSVRSEIETYAANNTGKYPLNKPTTTNCTAALTHGNFDDFYCNYIAKVDASCVATPQYKDDKDPSTRYSIFTNSSVTCGNLYKPLQCVSTAGATPGTTPCAAPTPTLTTGQAALYVHAKCNGSQAVSADGQFEAVGATVSTRSYAIVIALDRANTYYCVDNS